MMLNVGGINMDIKKHIVETAEYKQKPDVSLYQDVCHIIEQGRERAYNAVSQQMVETYWNIGRRIVEEEQQGKERAEYGEQIIEKLSKQLTTLDHNISTQYYERHFAQPQLPTAETEPNKFELLKSPIIAEFLGFKADTSFSEGELETAIISHLQDFLMEMGRGFAFMGRQQLVRTDTQDYFIDLVFYNVILKCYVLIDLKIGTITHQDVGQMDMYVRMYDELKRTEGDNPTIGIVLCSETSKDIARYSILKGNEQLFAAKYKTFLPTEEQLRTEIERQKQLFMMQHEGNNKKK